MKVAILTSVYGNYDTLKPTLNQKGVEIDWVYVTDHRPLDAAGWRVEHNLHWGKNPRYASKLPKCKPWEYTDATASIWIDASFQIISESFVTDMLDIVTNASNTIAQFRHPVRNCIYEEAHVVAEHRNYAKGQPILEQAEYYWEEGHPEQWGLWSSGVIVRLHTQQNKKMGHLWLDEIGDWSTCDQLSEPFVLRNLHMRPAEIPGMYHTGQNPWLEYKASKNH